MRPERSVDMDVVRAREGEVARGQEVIVTRELVRRDDVCEDSTQMVCQHELRDMDNDRNAWHEQARNQFVLVDARHAAAI
jgi:hypothetical protein